MPVKSHFSKTGLGRWLKNNQSLVLFNFALRVLGAKSPKSDYHRQEYWNNSAKIRVRFYVIKNLVFSLALSFAIIGLPSVAFAAESDPPTLTSFSIDTNVVNVGEIDQTIKSEIQVSKMNMQN